MYNSIIFDLDGTLLDTIADLANACNHTLSTMGLAPHPVQSYKQMVGNGIPTLIKRMLPEHSNGKATQALALQLFEPYYTKHMFDITAPYPGILSLLKILKNNNLKLAVASNKADEFTQEIVARYFPNTFDYVQGLRSDFPAKPAPAIIHSILSSLSSEDSSCLLCGDTDVDIHTANNAEIKSCGVLWGFRDSIELQAAGADFLVENTQQLLQIILKGNVSSL